MPQFERMLHDSAQLLDPLALAHAENPDPLYAGTVAATVGWLLRDMTEQNVRGRAAFASSEDADSEGEKGRFYVSDAADIDRLAGAAAPAFRAAYDVTDGGNWEGWTILRRITLRGNAHSEASLTTSRGTLLAARSRRIVPRLRAMA